MSDSVSDSFSQTMSGDQTRSGRERTTSGGARSASRCLQISRARLTEIVRVMWRRAGLTWLPGIDVSRLWRRGTYSA
jgi:hypothetical protein